MIEQSVFMNVTPFCNNDEHTKKCDILVEGQLNNNDFTSIIDIYFYETFSTLIKTISACTSLFRHPVWW